MRPTALRVVAGALLVLAAGSAAFVWWGSTPLGPGRTAIAAMKSDSSVRVTRADDGWEFAPVGGEPTAGLVFYPGGHVDARSYAPYARDIAARGFLVVVPVMPLSLAVLSPAAADDAVAAHPGISRWVIGGHSLGGAMAAQYASAHPSMKGLVLLASYPPSGADLSRTAVMALTEAGTLDTVLNRANLAAGRQLLPPSAVYVDLEGGNHAQFGDYGPQPGDGASPTMSAADQRLRAVNGTVAVLKGVSPLP